MDGLNDGAAAEKPPGTNSVAFGLIFDGVKSEAPSFKPASPVLWGVNTLADIFMLDLNKKLVNIRSNNKNLKFRSLKYVLGANLQHEFSHLLVS